MKLNREKIGQEDLSAVKTLNTVSETGSSAGLSSPLLDRLSMSYNDWNENNESSGYKHEDPRHIFVLNLIKTYSKWYRTRYEYEGLPKGITRELIESMLVRYGSIVGFKLNEEWVLTPYKVHKTDIYNKPTVVIPQPINGDFKVHKRRVGKDCFILRASGDIIFHNSQPLNSPLFLNWFSFLDISNQYNEIRNDTVLTRQRLGVGDDVDDTTANNIMSALISGKPVIRVDNSALKQILQGTTSGKNGIINFESRHESINATFKSMIDFLKLNNGWGYDENADKKERKIKDEMRTNSQTANNYLEADLETRANDWDLANEYFEFNVSVSLKELEKDEIESEDKGVE